MNIGDILSMFNKLERYKEEWLRGTEPREEEKLESSTWSIQKLGPWILNSPVRPSAIAKSNSRISKWPRADSTKDKLLKPGYSFATGVDRYLKRSIKRIGRELSDRQYTLRDIKASAAKELDLVKQNAISLEFTGPGMSGSKILGSSLT